MRPPPGGTGLRAHGDRRVRVAVVQERAREPVDAHGRVAVDGREDAVRHTAEDHGAGAEHIAAHVVERTTTELDVVANIVRVVELHRHGRLHAADLTDGAANRAIPSASPIVDGCGRRMPLRCAFRCDPAPLAAPRSHPLRGSAASRRARACLPPSSSPPTRSAGGWGAGCRRPRYPDLPAARRRSRMRSGCRARRRRRWTCPCCVRPERRVPRWGPCASRAGYACGRSRRRQALPIESCSSRTFPCRISLRRGRPGARSCGRNGGRRF